MTNPDLAPTPPDADAPFVLRIDDGGRGELEIPGRGGHPASVRVALPARCVRLLLALFFAAIEAEVTPPERDPRPTWRRGRPTLEDLARKLAVLADDAFAIRPEGVGTYMRTINQTIARASARAWPGRKARRLVEQRRGGRLAATLHVPGLATEPTQRDLLAYVDRYAKSLADPSLAEAFRARLKSHMQRHV